MYSVSTQFCGFIILFVLLIFIFHHKMLNLISEKIFVALLIVSNLCLFVDIISIFALERIQDEPGIFCQFVCRLFCALMMNASFLSFLYATAEDLEAFRSKRYTVCYLLNILSTVAVFVTPMEFYSDSYDSYTSGISVHITYFFSTLWVIVTIVYSQFLKSRTMSKVRRKAVGMWMYIWLITATIQFFNSKLSLIGFSIAVGMMILFFELENPAANLDRETGLFNAHSLSAFLNQQIGSDEFFAIHVICLADAHDTNHNTEVDAFVLNQMASYLLSFKKVWAFKDVANSFVLIVKDKDVLDTVVNQTMRRFAQPFRGQGKSHSFDPLYITLNDGSILKSSGEFLTAIRRIVADDFHIGDSHIILDEARLEGPRHLLETENMIIDAIADDRVLAYFQPIYDTKNEKIVSAEALVRIVDEDGNLVNPGVFIPVAEKTGLVSAIGEIVFNKTCQFLENSEILNCGIKYIEVNLSTVQAQQDDLAEMYYGIISRYNISPSTINLEITESSSITNMKKAISNMEQLIEKGFSFSLDDFGSGESNLNYIVDMPVSILKFDMDMTQAYFKNDKAKSVMSATLKMAHQLGLKVVAEGVETKEQLDEMVEIGIDYIQGYYFSKALSEDEYLRFVRDFNKE